jgi:hypothetical protein
LSRLTRGADLRVRGEYRLPSRADSARSLVVSKTARLSGRLRNSSTVRHGRGLPSLASFLAIDSAPHAERGSVLEGAGEQNSIRLFQYGSNMSHVGFAQRIKDNDDHAASGTPLEARLLGRARLDGWRLLANLWSATRERRKRRDPSLGDAHRFWRSEDEASSARLGGSRLGQLGSGRLRSAQMGRSSGRSSPGCLHREVWSTLLFGFRRSRSWSRSKRASKPASAVDLDVLPSS